MSDDASFADGRFQGVLDALEAIARVRRENNDMTTQELAGLMAAALAVSALTGTLAELKEEGDD